MTKRGPGRPPKAETVEARQAIEFKKRTLAARAKYDAAGNGRRLAGWNPPGHGPNQALTGLDKIRNRARDVSRNDWSGESGIQKWTTSLIGIGITPRFSRIKSKTRKQQILDIFTDFVAMADADCVNNLYGMQTLAVRSWMDAGEVFARRRARFNDEGLPVPMQIQLIEAEFVPMFDSDSYSGLPVGHKIRSGIELDKRGRRVAYWVYKEHPGDGSMMIGMPDELVRVAASDMCHIFEQKRPGQLRGVSMLAPVLNRLKNIENYDDATLTRQGLANLLVGFLTRGLPELDPDGDVNPMTGLENLDSPVGPLVGLQPGLMQELGPGEKVEWSNPPEAGTDYTAYMRTQHLGTAAGAGLPYEYFSGDIANVSDRTLRVIIQEFRRFCEQRQWQIVIPMFCQPVIDWFAQAALLAGLISVDEVEDVRRVEHAPHGWAHIHPVQDPQGKKLEVDAGFRSRSSVVSERGDDPEKVDDERKADDAREQDLEIGLYSAATVAAQAPAMDPADDTDEDKDPAEEKEKPPTALERSLIARADAETKALLAQATRKPAPAPEPDPNVAVANALAARALNLLEPLGGSAGE